MSFVDPQTRRVAVRAMLVSKALEALVEGRQTFAALIEITGLSQDALGDWIGEFRRRKLVHVEAWDLDPREAPTIAAFRWNPGAPDAERPAPLTNGQKSARWRAKARRAKAEKPAPRTAWIGGSPFAAEVRANGR